MVDGIAVVIAHNGLRHTVGHQGASKPGTTIAGSPGDESDPADVLPPWFPKDELPPAGFTIKGRPVEAIALAGSNVIVGVPFGKDRPVRVYDGCSDPAPQFDMSADCHLWKSGKCRDRRDCWVCFPAEALAHSRRKVATMAKTPSPCEVEF